MKSAIGVRRTILTLAMVLVFAGCTGKEETPKENTPPIISRFELTPKAPKVGTKIRSVVTAVDKDHDAVEIEFQWFVNGVKIAATDKDLETGEFEEDSQVYAMARAVEKDKGKASEWMKSNVLTLQTAPPPKLKGVTLTPTKLFAYNEPTATVDYGDLDPMDVDEVYYRWLVNGQVLDLGENYGPTLETENFKRGDTVQVQACASASFPDGYVASSYIITVINSPPTISTDDVSFEQDGEMAYIYINATDADGDELTYSLVSPPAGVTIDSGSGEVAIEVNKLQPGRYNIKVVANDGYGGQATFTYPATINPRGGR